MQTVEQKETVKKLIETKDRIEKLSLIREIIFGTQDGLLTTLGIISSIAGAFSDNMTVIVAGIANSLAGAFSMGTGAYLSSKAERQVHESEMRLEKRSISTHFEEEKQELKILFEIEKVDAKNAALITSKIAESPKSFFITMVQKEFGIEPHSPSSAVRDALYMGFSYLLASVIPLFPYFILPTEEAITVSIFMTLTALFILGILKARYARLKWWKAGLEIAFIGLLSGVGGYVLGDYLPRLF
ncbi:MAG: VIT1/CCC1 transporter family protein [Patescibacteria group bacterium]